VALADCCLNGWMANPTRLSRSWSYCPMGQRSKPSGRFLREAALPNWSLCTLLKKVINEDSRQAR